MTPEEAKALTGGHSAEVRRLSRMTLAQLKQESAAAGREWILGGPVRKDEFVREIAYARYPVAKLNQASHVLYHKPGEAWTSCEWCHPHGGAGCECERFQA